MPKLRAPTDEIVCNPTWPNAGVQAAYEAALRGPLRQSAAEIIQGVKEDWGRGVNHLAADAPSLDTLLRKRLDAWANRWTRKWDGMERRIADKFSRQAWTATDNSVRASFKKAGFTVKFKPTKPMLMAYNVRVQANITLIKSIPEQFHKDVSTKVWNAVTKGSDLNALHKDLVEAYAISGRRAALIARDQNNKAKASFERVRRMELGIVEAEWLHGGAGKHPRPTHLKAGREHTRYKIATGWLDPADNKHKHPGEDINCRCASKAIVPGLRRHR